MANTVIQLKHSTLIGNVPSSLANGEISINSRDGKFFYSTPAGVIVTHYPYPGPAGLNQEVQFNDSGVLGSDSGLTYNKTTDVITVVGGAIVGGVNVTPQIQLAFTQANTPSHVANSAASYANGAFGRANTAAVAANTPSHVSNSAASYANSSFARANNSLDANNGGTVTGTITATSFITTGSFGNILGANTIFANNFVANTGFIQFSDGSRQFTANTGAAYANSAFLAANTPSHVANSAASYANSGFTQANSNFTSAVTRLSVTASGSAAYLIDQYPGNNPSIYVSGGETIAFHLNVITGHPFMIRVSSGGANYNIGLTHVSNTGTILTGSSAQGQVTGTLYWKVPFDIVGSTYVYQCSIHGGMVGNIVIQQPASFVAANTALAFITANTPSHTANSAASYANGAFAAANSAGGAASAGSYANSAFTTANSSGSYANSAFAAANSASGAASAGLYANSAFLKANTPSHVANSAASYANSAFSTANTTITVGSYANSAFTLANSANIIAQGAYNFANTISGGSAIDNVARTSANSAGSYANSAFIHANSAFAVANTGGVTIGDVLALSIALG